MRNYLLFCTVSHRQHPGFNGMGGAPNLRAFCSCFRQIASRTGRRMPSALRLRVPKEESGNTVLSASRWKEDRPDRKPRGKRLPPRGLCGTDRWLPHAAPPRDPLNAAGARTLLGPPGGQGSVLLSGAFQRMPRSSENRVSG